MNPFSDKARACWNAELDGLQLKKLFLLAMSVTCQFKEERYELSNPDEHSLEDDYGSLLTIMHGIFGCLMD